MKKILSILVVLAMVMAFVPAALATTFEVTGQTFSSGVVTPTLATEVTDIVYKNCTFTNGAYLMLSKDLVKGRNVTIENCTFSGYSTTDYACSVYEANKITIIGNTVTDRLRGFNVVGTAAYPPGTLAFTGNNISLARADETQYYTSRNCGIQLAGPGWVAANTTISNNIFANAIMGVRLHDSFTFASGSAGPIYLAGNTFNNVTERIGHDPGDTSLTPELHASLDAVMAYFEVGQTEVKAGVDPTFMIIIPTKVDFGTLDRTMPQQSKDFIVSISNAVLESGTEVQIKVNSNNGYIMKAGEFAQIEYELENADKDLMSSDMVDYCTFQDTNGDLDDDLSASHVGKVKCNPAQIQKAGSYSDTMVFTISYVVSEA
jgi:hypothetical protein